LRTARSSLSRHRARDALLRNRLAQEAMTKVVPENEIATSIPSPRQKARAANRKLK
jgi:hypothetical protein